MSHISDRKYAMDQGLPVEAVRKLIKRLDVPFVRIGKGDSLVLMFDTEQLNAAIESSKKSKKDRRRGPRKSSK
ncbi:hypothetical protein K8I28_00125 [bacterium]|nr:hypothetical protein [bacterium]